MISLFFSYSHADEVLRDQLEKQLAMLKRQGVITTWHDRRIGAGQNIDRSIASNMEAADVILLLVSPDFIASDYCYEREMACAMERHAAGTAIVIPVILRACDWHHAPFGKLLATPIDGRPVTQWPDRDQAFLEVAKSIRSAVERLRKTIESTTGASPVAPPTPSSDAPIAPRSSNLRIAKQFTERDKDAFMLETFDYMIKFFEHSLDELQARNSEIQTAFRRIDARRFSSIVYRNGKSAARCTIFLGSGSFAKGIAYVAAETGESNSFNECLSVDTDDQNLFLRPMGMARFNGRTGEEKLTQEGASEMYWSMLIEPLQH